MGLSITGYTNVHVIREVTPDELTDYDFMDNNQDQTLLVHPNWPERMDGTDSDVEEFNPGGSYLFTADEKTLSWATGYGGYMRLREILCEVTNSIPVQRLWSMEDPSGFYLYELLCFADNEGTIGSAACARISQELNDVLYLFPLIGEEYTYLPLDDKYFREKIHDLAEFFASLGDKGIARYC